jgi:hypothetical protein
MNLKTAKALRKAARVMAASSGIVLDRQLVENESRRKYHFELLKDIDGGPIVDSETGRPKYNATFVAYGQMTNEPASVRGTYRSLKRSFKNTPNR